jgi:hypothetical protein
VRDSNMIQGALRAAHRSSAGQARRLVHGGF